MRKLITVFVSVLTACELSAPRGIETADVYKIIGQDESLLLAYGRFEDATGIDIPNPLLDHHVEVFWTDTPCPYRPEQWAVVQDGRCYFGRMWGCDEIYVAMNSQDPNHSCGTALLHEYGHCLRMDAGWDGDADHTDQKFWDFISEVRKETCQRNW